MYVIYLVKPGMKIELPTRCNSLAEACDHVEIYKRKNPYAYYIIKDVKNGYEFEI